MKMESKSDYDKTAAIVESLSDDAVFLFRMTIADMVDRMTATAREHQAHQETRARGYAMRESAERVRAKLESVTRP